MRPLSEVPSEERKAAIKRAVAAGQSISQAARDLDVRPGSLLTWAQAHQIPGAKPSALPPEEVKRRTDALSDGWREGKSTSDVAHELGMNPKTLAHFAHCYMPEPRPPAAGAPTPAEITAARRRRLTGKAY